MHLYKIITFQLDDIIFQKSVLTPVDIIFHNDGILTTNNYTNNKLVQTNEQFIDMVNNYIEHPENCILRGDIIKTMIYPCSRDGKLNVDGQIEIL